MSTQSKCFKCGGQKSSAREKMVVIYFDHQPDECFQVAIDRIEGLEVTIKMLSSTIETMSQVIDHVHHTGQK
jgi:hypothetical protein